MLKLTEREKEFLRSLVGEYHTRTASGATPTLTPTAKLNQWAKELKKRDRANDAEAPNPSASEDTSADDGSKARAK